METSVITARISKELKEQFEQLCEKENRTISNMIVTMIKKELLNND